jgi:hypothetical protein
LPDRSEATLAVGRENSGTGCDKEYPIGKGLPNAVLGRYSTAMQQRILIGTPSHGGFVKAGFASSLANLISDLGRRQIDCKFLNVSAAALPQQRDSIAHIFMQNKHFSHLLFIDSDMWFPADLAFRLLSFDKPIVGTVYARRELDFPGMKKKLASGASFEDAFARSFSYIVKPANKSYPDEGDLISVGGFGMGFVLIRADCLKRIKATCKLERYAGASGEQIHGFFLPLKGLSEDMSFCNRWHVQCGQPLWAYAKADILHIGDFSFGGPYDQAFRQGKQNVAPADKR